ncbi:MAG: lipid-A-disaccharide synthase [Planctomycetota bacterium]
MICNLSGVPYVFMSAGEPSGVNIGATLMRTLKRRLDGDVSFAGLGGQPMIDEGMRLIYDPAQTATMWLWGNLKRIPAHRRALRACLEDWERERPDVLVSIDYQAFHLYVGTNARRLGIPVVHFVSSQFWARRYHTLEPIRRAYSHVLCIHEFEKQFYDAAGIPATFVGHPLFERLRQRELDEATLTRLRAIQGPKLGILAGSRHAEISGCLPVMLDAARRLNPRPHLLVSVGRPNSRAFIEQEVQRSGLDATVLDFSSGEILSTADCALITSGSASMEAVYYGCPCAVVYRLSAFSYFFAKPLIVSRIAQPNLVAGREILPEFLLVRGDGARVAPAIQRLFDDEGARAAQREAFEGMRERLLSGPLPSEAAADVVMSLLPRTA